MISEARRKELLVQGAKIRIETLKSISTVGVGHLGGSMSVADLMAVLYFEVMRVRPEEPRWADRDWLVVSKGHCGPAVYSALALRGFFPMEWLSTLNQPGTLLPSHCDRLRTPGIDMSTGSLGQGLSNAVGIAIANRHDRRDSYTYAILGDGESQEGQNWEAALCAGHRHLDHLIVFVDQNGLQIDGRTEEVCDLGDMAEKFRAFGWHALHADGHDPAAICAAIDEAKAAVGKPSAIILHTIKGKGVAEHENQPSCHNTAVTPKLLEKWLPPLEAIVREGETK